MFPCTLYGWDFRVEDPTGPQASLIGEQDGPPKKFYILSIVHLQQHPVKDLYRVMQFSSELSNLYGLDGEQINSFVERLKMYILGEMDKQKINV